MKTCSVIGCAATHEGRGYCKEHYQQWYRYGDPMARLRAKRGTGWSDRDGYRHRSKSAEHVLVAERAIGRTLPEGAVVHHMDHNPANNSPANLVICPSQSYHLLIHMPERAIEISGDANHRRCMRCKQYGDPAQMRVHSRTRQTTHFEHRGCR